MSLLRLSDPRWYHEAMLVLALIVLLAMWLSGP